MSTLWLRDTLGAYTLVQLEKDWHQREKSRSGDRQDGAGSALRWSDYVEVCRLNTRRYLGALAKGHLAVKARVTGQALQWCRAT